MGKTIAQILGYIDARVPNALQSTDKIVYISDLTEDGEFRRHNTELVWNSTVTVTDQDLYDLPTGIKVTDLRYLGISPTTYNSTDVVASTTPFVEYKYMGLEDSRTGLRYFDHSTQLGISPTPEDAFHMRMIYTPKFGPYNASTDSTSIIQADAPLIRWLQFKMCAEICRSMKFPRDILGNNYEMEAMSAMVDAQRHYRIQRQKTAKRNTSYRGWWY